MDTSTRAATRRLDLARGLVVFLGLYQGGVPLLARLLFDADQRFAPALWLPAPWWWLACLAIVLVMVAILAVLAEARRRVGGDAATSGPAGSRDANATDAPDAEPTDRDEVAASFDAASAFVFLVGIYNGVAPFITRLLGRDRLLLSLPTRLDAPWWWIVSLVVLAVSIALLAFIDHRKQRHLAGRGA